MANARYTLENIDRGNEIGQWSDAKCEAFAAVINAADALRGATQEEVDAKTSELNQARTDFINNPNAVIKDELEAAISSSDRHRSGSVLRKCNRSFRSPDSRI